MPRYDYRCPVHGKFEVVHRMDEKPVIRCVCLRECRRVFTAPYFQEDRLRMWKARDGTRNNLQLGQEMPDSRQEYNRLLKERGQEAVPWSEVPAHFKRAQEYAEHVEHGGEALSSEEQAAYVNEPQEPEPSVAEQLKAIGYNRERGQASSAPERALSEAFFSE